MRNAVAGGSVCGSLDISWVADLWNLLHAFLHLFSPCVPVTTATHPYMHDSPHASKFSYWHPTAYRSHRITAATVDLQHHCQCTSCFAQNVLLMQNNILAAISCLHGVPGILEIYDLVALHNGRGCD